MLQSQSPQRTASRSRFEVLRKAPRIRWSLPLVLLLAGSGLAAFGQIQPVGRSNQVPQPQIQPPPFAPRPSTPVPSPAENRAFSEALSHSQPSAQAAALQAFLTEYPNSTLAPQVRQSLVLATARSGKPKPSLLATAPNGTAGQQTLQPVSLQASPPRRAIVELGPRSLAIKADNSSLSQILRELSVSTGLRVEGLTRDERIYGNFGPGEPRDVISALVAGLGYNFMMVGESSRGVPRQIILSVRATVAEAGAAAAPSTPPEMEQEQEVVQDDQTQPEIQEPGRSFAQPQMPGAQGPGATRSTQQMLEELRQMHPPPDGATPPPPQ